MHGENYSLMKRQIWIDILFSFSSWRETVLTAHLPSGDLIRARTDCLWILTFLQSQKPAICAKLFHRIKVCIAVDWLNKLKAGLSSKILSFSQTLPWFKLCLFLFFFKCIVIISAPLRIIVQFYPDPDSHLKPTFVLFSQLCTNSSVSFPSPLSQQGIGDTPPVAWQALFLIQFSIPSLYARRVRSN